MHILEINDIRSYMKLLFEALKHIHSFGIIHRDIKPSNFLYDFQQRKGLLVDFGLAQWTETDDDEECEQENVQPRQHSSSKNSAKKHGYFKKDSRPMMKASRAGTRGFRPPEVLFKVAKQTTKLDIWAAGIILLSLITKQFPVFNSQDDFDALIEIACVVGEDAMKDSASFYQRQWESNMPTIPDFRVGWRAFCKRFNPTLLDNEEVDSMLHLLERTLELTHSNRISAAEALQHPFFNP